MVVFTLIVMHPAKALFYVAALLAAARTAVSQSGTVLCNGVADADS